MIVFFLAEDPESGHIIEDAYLTPAPFDSFTKDARRVAAELGAFDLCRSSGLNLIDFDWGSETLWRLGFFRPKWGIGYDAPPHGIAADRWRNRLKSRKELRAYRAGVEAGREFKLRNDDPHARRDK